MLDICAVKIPKDISNSLFNKLIETVDKERKGKISKFVYKEDAYRTLIGDVLIRSMVCEKLKMTNEQVSFYTNEYGKPFVCGRPNFHFNVSHAGEWVVCISSSTEVGIDVEHIQPIDLDIAKYYFSELEYMDLQTKEDEEKTSYFYELWTLKESYIKARGMGLSIPLKDFCIRVRNRKIFLTEKEINENWFFKQYEIDPCYKLAVCSKENQFTCSIKIVTLEDMKLIYT